MEINNTNEQSDKTTYEVGDTIHILTIAGYEITGKLIEVSSRLANNQDEYNPLKYYKIGIVGTKTITLCENEIVDIYPVNIDNFFSYYKECSDFLNKFEKEKDVKLFLKKGVLLDDSVIMRNLLSKNIWETMSEEDKKKLIYYINLRPDAIVEIANCYCDVKKENKKLNDEKLKVLEGAIKFMDVWSNTMKESPTLAPVLNVLFRQMGIDKLINMISN